MDGKNGVVLKPKFQVNLGLFGVTFLGLFGVPTARLTPPLPFFDALPKSWPYRRHWTVFRSITSAGDTQVSSTVWLVGFYIYR